MTTSRLQPHCLSSGHGATSGTSVGGLPSLWVAAENGNLACCSLLVARGADMALRDTRGRNALGASSAGSHSTEASREEVMKLLIELGCPVEEAEVDAAWRSGLADSFAKAVTARTSEGSSARELAKAISLACSPAGVWAATEGVWGVAPDADPVAPMLIVRVSSEPPPTFSSSRGRVASASKVVTSSKEYHVRACTDSPALPSCVSPGRWKVSHVEGPDEVDKRPLLKLLLPPPAAGWASFYRDGLLKWAVEWVDDESDQRPG